MKEGSFENQSGVAAAWEIDNETINRIIRETRGARPDFAIEDEEAARRVWTQRIAELRESPELKFVVSDNERTLEPAGSETVGEGLDFDVALGLLGISDRHEYVHEAIKDPEAFGRELEQLLGKPVRVVVLGRQTESKHA